jgi:hypothetical protein
MRDLVHRESPTADDPSNVSLNGIGVSCGDACARAQFGQDCGGLACSQPPSVQVDDVPTCPLQYTAGYPQTNPIGQHGMPVVPRIGGQPGVVFGALHLKV